MIPPLNEYPPRPPQPPPPPPQSQFQSSPTGIPLQIPGHAPARWSSGLCDCCEDCNSCCQTFWCPCITFGQIADIVDKGTNSCATCGTLYAVLLFTGFACLYSCCYRTKLRRQYALAESPCPDCLVHCCCEPCALCQEYRELKSKGFDMSIGWHGNLERQNHRVTLPPPMQPGMHR